MHPDNAQPLIILRTHEFAEEVADLAACCNDFEVVAFAENREQERCRGQMLGKPIIWIDLGTGTEFPARGLGSFSRETPVPRRKHPAGVPANSPGRNPGVGLESSEEPWRGDR